MGSGMAVLVQSFIDRHRHGGGKGKWCTSGILGLDDQGNRYLVEKKEAKIQVRNLVVSM